MKEKNYNIRRKKALDEALQDGLISLEKYKEESKKFESIL